MLVIFSALHFPVHSQLEKFLGRRLSEELQIDFRYLICDSLHKLSFGTDISDCEVHDHLKRTYQHSPNISELESACKRCASSKIKYFDDISADKFLFSSSLLNNYHKFALLGNNKPTWKARRDILKELNIELDNLMENRILSSLFTRLRVSTKSELARIIINPKTLENSLDSAFAFYLQGRLIGKELISRFGSNLTLLMFNGRFNPGCGIKDELAQNNTNYILHERGYTKESFTISINHDPGNPFASYRLWLKKKGILKTVTEKDLQRLDTYFNNRRKGSGENGFIFKGHKNKEHNSLIKNNQYIAVFTSSSDEISGYHSSCTFQNQFILIKNLAELGLRLNIKVIVRQHPNLGLIGRHTKATDFLESIRVIRGYSETLEIIEPEDNVDSYALAANAKFIFSPQSSIYLELITLSYPVLQILESPYNCIANSSLSQSNLYNETMASLEQELERQLKRRYIAKQIAAMHFIKSSIRFDGCKIINRFQPSEDKLNNNLTANDSIIIKNLSEKLKRKEEGYFTI